MFLHAIVDGTFSANLRRMFEDAAPGESHFVLYSRGAAAPYGHHCDVARSVPELLGIAHAEGPWDGMTVNGLSADELVELAAGLPDDLPVAWYVWGYEAYGRAPALRRQLLLPETRAATRRPRPGLRRRLSGLRDLWAQGAQDVCDVVHPPFNRYDFCVTQLPEEYALFRKHRLFTRTRYHWGAVGALEDYVDISAPIEPLGRDIQIGNCAASSMNHLDVFQQVAALCLEDSAVVVPLGYGDSLYREHVLQAGSKLFGKRFVPLLEHIPLREYNKMMQRCGVVVMSQRRQQAIGTIVAALWRGAIVYMNDTTLYRAYRRMGIDVRLLATDFARDAESGFPPLDRAQIEAHRRRLLEHHGRARVGRETRSLLQALSEGR